jgi:ubiquinone biosynthesis UbiH/UbiF/VisC/COQ6 family hydroxylase
MKYDIIVIGAGPIGLIFARSLAETGLKIVIIEKKPLNKLAKPEYDGREIALTHFSYKILKRLEILDFIPKKYISKIKNAKVLNEESSYSLIFDTAQNKKDSIGFVISNNRILKAGYNSIKHYKNIKILNNQEVVSIGVNEKATSVGLLKGNNLQASLIVAADSRFSPSRRILGVPTSILDFGRTCIVCNMSIELDHMNTAYEMFKFDKTVAVIPLNNYQVSIVITVNSSESNNIINMSVNKFEAYLEDRLASRFGKMKLTSSLFSYPLISTYAKKFSSNKVAFIGDAAVGMHPVTAHGFNLGIRSINILSGLINKSLYLGNDFSSVKLLEEYDKSLHKISFPLYHATNILVKLYTNNSITAKYARRLLLRLGNNLNPAKNYIIKKLMDDTL